MNTITFNDYGHMMYNTDKNTAEDMLDAAQRSGKYIESSWIGTQKCHTVYNRNGNNSIDIEPAFIIVVAE